MSNVRLKRESDNLVRYVGPYSKSANLPMDVANYAGALVNMSLYAEDYEMRVEQAWVRNRAVLSAGATAFTSPHFSRHFLQTGDDIYWIDPDGTEQIRQGITVTAGTDQTTPATNFDTISWAGTPTRLELPIGHKFFLLRKGPNADKFPVSSKKKLFEAYIDSGITLELETEVPGTLITSTPSTLLPSQAIVATEDGDIAENQEVFDILDVGAGGASNVDPGRRIRVKLGPTIVMTEYPVGTHVAGNDDWGWEGTVPDLLGNFAEVRAGDLVRIVVTLSGVAGLQDVESILAKVVER